MSISFCTVRIEIADEEKPLNHLKFNCGRSLEDLLEGLDLNSGVSSASTNYTMDDETKKKKEAARKKARGTRKMTDIVVETYTSPFEATAHGGASQVSRKSSTKSSKESSPGRASADYESSKESTPASNRSTKDSTPSGATNDNPDQINFISGNPFVEVTKGILHLYKENQTTSLEDGVVRSPMICKYSNGVDKFFTTLFNVFLCRRHARRSGQTQIPRTPSIRRSLPLRTGDDADHPRREPKPVHGPPQIPVSRISGRILQSFQRPQLQFFRIGCVHPRLHFQG